MLWRTQPGGRVAQTVIWNNAARDGFRPKCHVGLHPQGCRAIHVAKDPDGPCCNAWIGHLQDNGFSVSFDERSIEALDGHKREHEFRGILRFATP